MNSLLCSVLFLTVLALASCASQPNIVSGVDQQSVKPMCNPAIAAQFLRWNKGNGKALKGLTNRRLAEQKLFLRGC